MVQHTEGQRANYPAIMFCSGACDKTLHGLATDLALLGIAAWVEACVWYDDVLTCMGVSNRRIGCVSCVTHTLGGQMWCFLVLDWWLGQRHRLLGKACVRACTRALGGGTGSLGTSSLLSTVAAFTVLLRLITRQTLLTDCTGAARSGYPSHYIPWQLFFAGAWLLVGRCRAQPP